MSPHTLFHAMIEIIRCPPARTGPGPALCYGNLFAFALSESLIHQNNADRLKQDC